jgi:hypothetical protein
MESALSARRRDGHPGRQSIGSAAIASVAMSVFDSSCVSASALVDRLNDLRWQKMAFRGTAMAPYNKRMQRTVQSVTYFAKRKMRATLLCR